MPLNINWKGKIGYGDIISPISYAMNEAERRDDSTYLTFHFAHEDGTKFKEQDAETINDRVDFIWEHTQKPRKTVRMMQMMQSRIAYDHTNYHPTSQTLPYHNLRFSNTYRWNGAGDHIAIVPSTRNKKQFRDYAPKKVWKDPLVDRWESFASGISNKVELVHYETPIEEASEILSTAKLVIGYHGSAMWLARWIGAPMVVYSDRTISRDVFPWCIHNPLQLHILIAIAESLEKRDNVIRELDRYLEGE